MFDQMGLEAVPNAVDNWAFLKIVHLLGLDTVKKPSLILFVSVPTLTSSGFDLTTMSIEGL